MAITCFECQAEIEGEGEEALGEALLAHARGSHEWPFDDTAIRNYAAATLRLTGPSERLDEIGPIEVHRVAGDRIDDFLSFFDHDAFVGKPEWAACYCLEPHTLAPGTEEPSRPWREKRADMQARLEAGGSWGYLAYVDGRPAGWVNASLRRDYAMFRRGDDFEPPDEKVIGVSCFVIAPPYRRHGVAGALLDRVIADAPERGAQCIEAYPFNDGVPPEESGNFRGPVTLYTQRGFEEVKRRERDTVVRRPV